MKFTIVYKSVLLLLLATLSSAEYARGASGDPPTILPRITMMTHGVSERCKVFFSADGKRLIVIPKDIRDTIAKAPKNLGKRGANGGSAGSAVVQSARDQVADGSMFRGADPKPDPHMIDGKVVRGGEKTAAVMVYDVESGRQVARWGNGFEYFDSNYIGTAISPDGKTFAGNSWKTASIDLWDVASGTLRATIDTSPDSDDTGGYVPIAITPDSKHLVACIYIDAQRKRVVRRYDLNSGEPIDEFNSAKNAFGLALSSDGRFLATDNTIWDMNSGKMACEIQHEGRSAKRYLCGVLKFTPDGKYLLANKPQNGLSLADLARGTVVEQMLPSRYKAWDLSPDGSLIAVYQDSGKARYRVQLYDFSTRRMIAQLAPVPNSTYSLRFSPDGKTLAAGCYDGATRLWDISRFVHNDKSK